MLHEGEPEKGKQERSNSLLDNVIAFAAILLMASAVIFMTVQLFSMSRDISSLKHRTEIAESRIGVLEKQLDQYRPSPAITAQPASGK